MADRAPPSRYSVIERGARLVVIDNQTGNIPPTAAERMEEHDRARGVEPIKPPRLSQVPDISDKARAASGLAARPAPLVRMAPTMRPASIKPNAVDPVRANIAATLAERNQQEWAEEQEDRPRPSVQPAPARIAHRAAPQAGGNRQTIVTGKWWDAKGPRSITLGPKGQARMRSGFITPFLVLVMAALVILFVQPLLLLIGAFVMLRFGNKILAPMGAAIIDKAMAERE